MRRGGLPDRAGRERAGEPDRASESAREGREAEVRRRRRMNERQEPARLTNRQAGACRGAKVKGGGGKREAEGKQGRVGGIEAE